MPFKVNCKCQHCDQAIEFDRSQVGNIVTCPGCGSETTLFMPPEPRRPAPRAEPEPVLDECSDCRAAISRRAVFCPSCGAIPSLWRVGWYVFVVMGVLGIIGFVFWIVFAIIMKAVVSA